MASASRYLPCDSEQGVRPLEGQVPPALGPLGHKPGQVRFGRRQSGRLPVAVVGGHGEAVKQAPARTRHNLLTPTT